jgi:multidrug resistance efflux pump
LTNHEPTRDARWQSGRPRRVQGRCAYRRFRQRRGESFPQRLPAENATGNWVKIVQRVPVKIVMDDPPTDVALGPGMSVEASVRVNPNPLFYERLRGWL